MAKTLVEMRRKVAREKGLGRKLAQVRKKRAKA